MIHALLAAALCTTALLIAAIEHFRKTQTSSMMFFICYGVGAFGWMMAGLHANSISLVVISILQAAAALICAWFGFLNRKVKFD